MAKLTCVNMIRINGVWKRQDEIPPEIFQAEIEKIFDKGMKNIGFERDKEKAYYRFLHLRPPY